MLRVVVDFSGANARGGEVVFSEDKEHLDRRSAGVPFWRCFLARFFSRSSIGLRVLGEDENESAGAAGDETGAGTGAVLGVERTASGVGGTDSCSFGRCSRPVSPLLCSAGVGAALRVPVSVSVSVSLRAAPTPTPTVQRPAWRFWFSLVRRPLARSSRSLLGGGAGEGRPRPLALLLPPVPPARGAGRSPAVVLDVAAGVAADDRTVAEAGRTKLEVADFHAGEQSAKRSIGGPAEGRGRNLQVSRSTSLGPARVNSRGAVLLSVLRSRWPRGRGGRGGSGRLVRAATVVVFVVMVVGGTSTHGLLARVFVRGAPKLQLLTTGSASFSPVPGRGRGR